MGLIALAIDCFDFKGRHRWTTAIRLVDEEIAADGGNDAAGFGHTIARAGPSIGDGLIDFPNEVGLQLRAATADRNEARGVIFIEIWVGDQFSTHNRHAGQVCHLFAFDQCQGGASIPLVHVH